ncbi:ribonuclease Y [Candidatus Bipolaricaulota bacterium]|nr:ribonuclease Y [Candidatus Bipolaricaulota bacterium]
MLAIYIGSSAVLALAIGIFLGQKYYEKKLSDKAEDAASIIERARKTGENIKKEKVLEGQQKIQEQREELEEKFKSREKDLEKREERIMRKADRLSKKSDHLEEIEESLKEDQEKVKALKKKGKELISKEKEYLEELAGMSSEEAKAELMDRIEQETERHYARKVNQAEKKAEEKADEKSRQILATAMQRYAAEQAEGNTVSSVSLPSDDFKGRVIGRNGRNIKTFEALTGVEVMVDDTPEMVVLSSFHPVRREIARLAMEELVEDGRIHPVQIEEKVDKARDRMVERIKEAGQNAALDTGVDLSNKLIPLVGKLKFRTSYGQNLLRHSLEVSFISGMLAEELGLNHKPARRAGLLHDIGKSVDHEVTGTHAEIGAELARRYGEKPLIVNAIAAHHEDEEPESLLPILLKTADTLSATRPGARRETYEKYIERLENLEEIAHSFEGVKKANAFQAGREIRVVVSPEKVNDNRASKLAYDIAREIERDLDYPGEVKINVIRKAQFVEAAQ